MPGGRLHKAWCSGSVLERGESGEGIGLFSLDHLVARVFIVHLAVVVKRHGGKRQDRLLLNPVGDGETAAADDNLLIITLFIERERIGLCLGLREAEDEFAADGNAHGLVAARALHDDRALERETCGGKSLNDAESRHAELQGALERLNEVRELRHFVKLKRALHGLAGAGDFENIERKRHGHPQ